MTRATAYLRRTGMLWLIYIIGVGIYILAMLRSKATIFHVLKNTSPDMFSAFSDKTIESILGIGLIITAFLWPILYAVEILKAALWPIINAVAYIFCGSALMVDQAVAVAATAMLTPKTAEAETAQAEQPKDYYEVFGVQAEDKEGQG